MSLTKAVTIWCDATWCYKWENYNEAKAKDTRKSAKSDGWVSTKHGDFCCLEHSKGKRTKAEKEWRKDEKRQLKQDKAAGLTFRKVGDSVPGDNGHSYGGHTSPGTTSGISSLVTSVKLEDMEGYDPVGPPF